MRKLSLCQLTIIVFKCLWLASVNSGNVFDFITGSFLQLLEKNSENYLTSKKVWESPKAEQEQIIVSFVACGYRINESLSMVKSVLIFTSRPVHFVVFSDDELRIILYETLSNWKELTMDQFTFELHEVKFPEKNNKFWMKLYRICSTQRLFFPDLLPHIDSLIYVDIDTLFLGPVEKLWRIFSKFNSSQIAAITLASDAIHVSWYAKVATHPFYGKLGLNAGVILMNLTRMRSFGWTKYIAPVVKKWKHDIRLGDQDIINIIFHYYPAAVFELPCRYNYRPAHCNYGSECESAKQRGVFLIHGSPNVFTNDDKPAFKAIYRAIEEYEVGTDPSETLLLNMEMYFSEIPPLYDCVSLKHLFFKVPEETLRKMYGKSVRNDDTSGWFDMISAVK